MSEKERLRKSFKEWCDKNNTGWAEDERYCPSHLVAFMAGHELAKKEMEERLAEAEELLDKYAQKLDINEKEFVDYECREYFKKWGVE